MTALPVEFEHIELSLLSDKWGESGASNTGVNELSKLAWYGEAAAEACREYHDIPDWSFPRFSNDEVVVRGMREDRELSHEFWLWPDSMFACNGKQHLILHGDDWHIWQVESDKKPLT